MSDPSAANAVIKHQKAMVGRVVSTKMQRTVVVAVSKTSHHRLYKRAIRVTRKYFAHDETDALAMGDVVRIVETRPLSRLKRWRVTEIVRRAAGEVIDVADPTTDDAEATEGEA